MNSIHFDQKAGSVCNYQYMGPLIKAKCYSDSQGKTTAPCNIEFINEHQTQLSLDISGYPKASLNLEFGARSILIRGNAANNKESTLLYRGIANVTFECIFYLADYVEVVDVQIINGLLVFHLIRDNAISTQSLTIPNQNDSKYRFDPLHHKEVKLAA